MAETKITTDYYLPQTTNNKSGSTDLGKDDFLKLLITQMQNQDPTNPMDDKDSIAQMAQFSALEQMQNVAKGITELTAVTNQSQLIQFNSFVGKTVTWHEATDELDEAGVAIVNTGTEKVKSVKYNGTEAIFVLESGKEILAANISEVADSTSTGTNSTNSLIEASMLIGKMVQYLDENQSGVLSAVTSVSKKDGNIMYQLANGTSITADQMTSISAG